jgi:transcriptional regulator with XRE-family HTH domain
MNRFPTINLVKTGNNITRLMKQNNIKVVDLQEIFGFEYPQAIYKWRRGECLPTIDNLIILSTIFKTPIDKILVLD